MVSFAHVWLLGLLPLPWFVFRFVPAYRKRAKALHVPFFQKLVILSGEQARHGAVVSKRPFTHSLLMILMWCGIVVALARPQYIGPPIIHEKSARDLMVAVDLSGSMDARDFVSEEGLQIDRLTAVKAVLLRFVKQRSHDRLGLIVFGDTPFLQAPFTQDHRAWTRLLEETRIAMAGMSTAFGDAIGLAIKHFRENESKNRVLIVLTDGNDTGSRVPPIEAAKVAKRFGVTIYPVAIGDPQSSGEEALDISTLERVAELTGGAFYHAMDRKQLKSIYQRIGELEPQLYDAQSYRPRQDLHHIPMAFVTLSMLAFMVLAIRRAKMAITRSQS